jgi:hypothetical protein
MKSRRAADQKAMEIGLEFDADRMERRYERDNKNQTENDDKNAIKKINAQKRHQVQELARGI